MQMIYHKIFLYIYIYIGRERERGGACVRTKEKAERLINVIYKFASFDGAAIVGIYNAHYIYIYIILVTCFLLYAYNI